MEKVTKDSTYSVRKSRYVFFFDHFINFILFLDRIVLVLYYFYAVDCALWLFHLSSIHRWPSPNNGESRKPRRQSNLLNTNWHRNRPVLQRYEKPYLFWQNHDKIYMADVYLLIIEDMLRCIFHSYLK